MVQYASGMIPKAATTIQKADIDALIENARIEDRTIEYKRDLPGPADEDRREFLRDVSAFVNGLGGDIVYGIEEKAGIPTSAPGVAIVNFDDLRLRLQNILQSSLAPPLPLIEIEQIEGFPNGSVLLLRAHQSWRGPHMVTFKGLRQFFVRGNGEKHAMDVVELRAAFVGSEALNDRIRSFRDGRIARILAGESPIKSLIAPTLVLHLIPVDTSFNRVDFDIRSIERALSKLNEPGQHPALVYASFARPNLDGVAIVSSAYEQRFGLSKSYTQVFRNGGIEFAEAQCEPGESGLEPRYLDGNDAEIQMLDLVRNAFRFRKQIELSGPVLLSLSLLHVDGSSIMPAGRRPDLYPKLFDRDIVVLPEVITYEDPIDYAKTLRPLFDSMWQAAGHRGSYSYDADGSYNARRG